MMKWRKKCDSEWWLTAEKAGIIQHFAGILKLLGLSWKVFRSQQIDARWTSLSNQNPGITIYESKTRDGWSFT